MAAQLQTGEPETPTRSRTGDETTGSEQLPRLVRQHYLSWLQPIPPEPALRERLLASLRDYLGERTFHWLAACAVFPGIYPALTLFLGERLRDRDDATTPLGDETGMLKLARLPWFRHGTMPDWLRVALIQGMTNPQVKAVRTRLTEFLLRPRQDSGSGPKLKIAAPHDKMGERLRALFVKIRREPQSGALREQIFLTFMIGRWLTPLTVTAPRALQQLLLSSSASAVPGAVGMGIGGSVFLWLVYQPLDLKSNIDAAGTVLGKSLGWLIPLGFMFALGGSVLWNKFRERAPTTAAVQESWSRRLISTVTELWSRWDLSLMSFLFSVYLLNSLWEYGFDLRQWDMLFTSGIASFIVAIWLVRRLPERIERSLEALITNGALFVTPHQLQSFQRQLETLIQRWAQGGGLLIGLVIALAFLGAFGSEIINKLPLLTLEVIAGYIAGIQIGRMIGYGQLAPLLKRAAITFRVIPDHADGAGGLKPIGHFYLFQVLIIMIPAVYLTIWWLIIPWWGQYAPWRTPYLGLLGVVLVLAILVCILPLLLFHREMRQQKQARRQEADNLAQEAVAIRGRLAAEASAETRESLQQRLAYLDQRREAIEQMPTWPLSASLVGNYQS